MTHLLEQRKIINSKAFRRLADKTQVICSDTRDAQVRSRLTHSLEVAAISKEICLNIQSIHNYVLDVECVFNVALLHDIGMVALGHLGEDTLQEVFFEKTGLVFESNANNLVVIEKNLPFLNKLTLVSTIKYPYLFASTNKNKKAKGMYKSQYDTYFSLLQDIIMIQNQYPHIERNRTYECDVMEIADDLAYLLSDLSDAIFSYKISISKEQLLSYFREEGLVNPNLYLVLLNIINNKDINALEALRENFIDNVYFNNKTNAFDFKDKDLVKLQHIIRKIDWDLYIAKFSLVEESEVIQKYKAFLYFVIEKVKENPEFVANEVIISQTYRHKFLEGIEANNLVKAYKYLLITIAEWTDTIVIQKLKYFEKYLTINNNNELEGKINEQ